MRHRLNSIEPFNEGIKKRQKSDNLISCLDFLHVVILVIYMSVMLFFFISRDDVRPTMTVAKCLMRIFILFTASSFVGFD